MRHISGGYYLHENGKIIHRAQGLSVEDRKSDFVVCYWDITDIAETPHTFLRFLVEAKEVGANQEDIDRLVDKHELLKYIPDFDWFWKRMFK